jgi:hypothetical protein
MRSTPRSEEITLSRVTGTNPPEGQHNWHPDQAQQYPPAYHTPPTPLPPGGGFYSNPTPPPPPRKPPAAWIAAVIAVVVIGVVVAIGVTVSDSDREPTNGIGTPAPYDALPNQQASPTTGKDSAGQRACDAVKKANAGNITTHDPAAMAAIAIDGKQSTNPFVRADATTLGETASAAVAAKGTDDEPWAGIRLGTAALELETTCIQQWYYPRPS